MDKCPECSKDSVEECDVSGDWICSNCDWWIDADEYSESVEEELYD
jgi:ribosomal protein L37AE/L43A